MKCEIFSAVSHAGHPKNWCLGSCCAPTRRFGTAATQRGLKKAVFKPEQLRQRQKIINNSKSKSSNNNNNNNGDDAEEEEEED